MPQSNEFSLPVSFPRSYWVIPGLFLAGEYPGAKDRAEAMQKQKFLFDAGIRKIINLMESDETDHSGKFFDPYENYLNTIAEKHSSKISCVRFPVKDLDIPDSERMRQILDTIDQSIDQRKPVYVHCWGGIGRTGTVIGCFLIRHGLATAGNVLDVIARLRKNDPKNYRTSPETPAQVEFVKTWAKNCNGPTRLNRCLGCMIGGAVGDALGAPVEFMRLDEIRQRYGDAGISDYDRAYGRIGAITDDTQMALFTAEGLLRAWTRGNTKGICHPPPVVHHAYLRWLKTQEGDAFNRSDFDDKGFLAGIPELCTRRAPGNSCLSALHSPDIGTMERPVNNSKGCGGVMRVAPVGLMADDPEEAFNLGCEVAAITHGHPSGYLASGVLAAIINLIKSGGNLPEAINEAARILKQRRDHAETFKAIVQALDFADKGNPAPETIEKMGGGWVAEEALAISLYCALCAENNFKKGVLLAVNHSGDSDSTGAITGNILGCLLGHSSIPLNWIAQLELKAIIQELGIDLFIRFREDDHWWKKYPGW